MQGTNSVLYARLEQGFSNCHLRPENSLLYKRYFVHCRMFRSIFGLYPLDTNSTTPLLPIVKNKNTNYCQTFCWSKNHSYRKRLKSESQLSNFIFLNKEQCVIQKSYSLVIFRQYYKLQDKEKNSKRTNSELTLH